MESAGARENEYVYTLVRRNRECSEDFVITEQRFQATLLVT
jgi:hypothetical protein